MRRLVILAIVALLGFAPLCIRSVAAQSWEGYQDYEAWQGVKVQDPVTRDPDNLGAAFELLAEFLGAPPQDADPGSMSSRLDRVYRVDFNNFTVNSEHRAVIPEVQGAEFMVVIVSSGEFVLDVKGPGSFLVDPAADPELAQTPEEEEEELVSKKIRVMHAMIDGRVVHYNPTDQFVLDEKGRDCTNLCTVLPGTAVQLTDHDRIIAPAGAICIWCLLNQSAHAGEAQGQLYAFPLLDVDGEFSWEQYDDESAADFVQVATTEQNGYATPEQLTGAAPWAYFNPSSNCRT
jgi:hypothetical protein